MVNREIAAAKLAELADRVSRVRAHCPADAASLRTNRDTLDLVAFNLMLAVQTCSDLAGHIIADEGWPAATKLAESFERLHERGVISRAVSDAMARAVGLRNVAAHGYQRVDVGYVFDGATRGLADLDAYAKEVSAWIEGRTGRP
jgi:uncharacterized protein YutE (UPF0331/DUF86 family)